MIGMTPNQMTLASAISTFSAIAILAVTTPSLATGLVIAGLLILGFVLDSSDGQLARLTGASSPSGESLDHVVDRLVRCSLTQRFSFRSTTSSSCLRVGSSPSHWCSSSRRSSCSLRARSQHC